MEEKARGARSAAFRVLNRVEGGDAYADILIMKETEGMPALDAALATEIAYGVLRWKIRLDYTIDLFASIKAKKLEHRVLNALRIGVYQLLFLDRVPPSAAINETVKLLRKDGPRKSGFVNAVLRKMHSERAGVALPDSGSSVKRLSIIWSHPEWIVKRWVERYGEEEAGALCNANQEVPPKVVRVNTLKTTLEKLIEELKTKGYEAHAGKYSPFAVEVKGGGPMGAFDPAYYIQDEASQIISMLVSPSPGSSVLDACSAPGGKTTHMAQLMGNRGSILALDKHASRLEAVERSAARLGVKIIKTREADAAKPFVFAEENSFDYILCDAPCSGLGVVRRSPDIKYRRRAEDIQRLAATQGSLLDNLARYLKKGGILIYSTCTFEHEETAEAVESFLKRNTGFALEHAASVLPGSCAGLVDEKGFFRSFPHRHGMDGFFGARMRRL